MSEETSSETTFESNSEGDETTYDSQSESDSKSETNKITEDEGDENTTYKLEILTDFFSSDSKILIDYLKKNDLENIDRILQTKPLSSWIVCYAIDHSNNDVLQLILSKYRPEIYDYFVIINHTFENNRLEIAEVILNYYGNQQLIMFEAVKYCKNKIYTYLHKQGYRINFGN